MRHTPLGYQMRRGKIVIIEKYAETVRWIFNSYVNGISQKSIARELSERRVPTGNGRYKWSQCGVRSILTNRKYIGDEYHPRIIEPYIFDSAQEKRKEKNNAMNCHPRSAHLQPLSGKCKCGKCGASYRYVKGDWRCGNYIKDNKVSCDNDIVADADLLETVVLIFQYLKEHRELVVAEPEVREKKTSIKVNDVKLKMRRALKVEHLSYEEFRELAYQKAQERYKVSPIWDRDYCNEKLQNYLKFNDIAAENIREIVALIKCIELYPDGELVVTMINDLYFKYKVVEKG
ncbi:MAG: recombinase family protein [[Clostridium] innocuum]|nr:recombinase family protein [[Clostridium] innocuum]MBS5684773.1 recombinase family protein [[Clostridium] innocuum]